MLRKRFSSPDARIKVSDCEPSVSPSFNLAKKRGNKACGLRSHRNSAASERRFFLIRILRQRKKELSRSFSKDDQKKNQDIHILETSIWLWPTLRGEERHRDGRTRHVYGQSLAKGLHCQVLSSTAEGGSRAHSMSSTVDHVRLGRFDRSSSTSCVDYYQWSSVEGRKRTIVTCASTWERRRHVVPHQPDDGSRRHSTSKKACAESDAAAAPRPSWKDQ